MLGKLVVRISQLCCVLCFFSPSFELHCATGGGVASGGGGGPIGGVVPGVHCRPAVSGCACDAVADAQLWPPVVQHQMWFFFPWPEGWQKLAGVPPPLIPELESKACLANGLVEIHVEHTVTVEHLEW